MGTIILCIQKLFGRGRKSNFLVFHFRPYKQFLLYLYMGLTSVRMSSNLVAALFARLRRMRAEVVRFQRFQHCRAAPNCRFYRRITLAPPSLYPLRYKVRKDKTKWCGVVTSRRATLQSVGYLTPRVWERAATPGTGVESPHVPRVAVGKGMGLRPTPKV